MNMAEPGGGHVGTREPLSLRLAASLAAVEEARSALFAYLEPQGIEARVLNRIEVALEELISNVVRHGEIATFVEIAADYSEGAVTISVTDDGVPFNPLARAEPARFDKLENATLGGLGIGLVKRLAKAVAYDRVKGLNRTSAVFAPA